jgi:hypothetical protein
MPVPAGPTAAPQGHPQPGNPWAPLLRGCRYCPLLVRYASHRAPACSRHLDVAPSWRIGNAKLACTKKRDLAKPIF